MASILQAQALLIWEIPLRGETDGGGEAQHVVAQLLPDAGQVLGCPPVGGRELCLPLVQLEGLSIDLMG